MNKPPDLPRTDPPDIATGFTNTTRACLEALNTVYNCDNYFDVSQNSEVQYEHNNCQMETDIRGSPNNLKRCLNSSNENGQKNKLSNTGQSFISSALSTTPVSTDNYSNLTSVNNICVLNNDDNSNVSQNVILSALEKNKSNRYSAMDAGPYFVIVESKNADANIGRLHPIALGKLIFKTFKFHAKDIKNIGRLGYNRIKIETNSFIIANKILDSQSLLPPDLSAYIPESKLFRKGVIRYIDTDINVSEIISVADSEIKIVDVRRITRRITLESSTKIVKIHNQ